MRVTANALLLAIAVFLSLMPWSARAGQDEAKSKMVQSNGTGTLKLRDEAYKVDAVVIKLFEDGKTEMHIVSDITILVTGTWSRPADASKPISLKITRGVAGRLDATGELLIAANGESIESVSLQGESGMSHRRFSLTFRGR